MWCSLSGVTSSGLRRKYGLCNISATLIDPLFPQSLHHPDGVCFLQLLGQVPGSARAGGARRSAAAERHAHVQHRIRGHQRDRPRQGQRRCGQRPGHQWGHHHVKIERIVIGDCVNSENRPVRANGCSPCSVQRADTGILELLRVAPA